jgi:hypothetical protein
MNEIGGRVPFAWILNMLFRDKPTHGVNHKAKEKARRHRKEVKRQKRRAA